MTVATHKCCASSGSGWHSYPCGRGAKFEREGKWYCGTHDPVARTEKKAKRDAAWNAEFDARRAVRKQEEAEAAEQKRRADCYPELLEALRLLTISCETGSDDDGLSAPTELALLKARAAIAKAQS